MKKSFVIIYVFMFSFLNLFANTTTNKQSKEYYLAKDYSYLLEIDDFDKSLMQMHITLYEGYVKNVNMLLNQLNNLDSSSNISKALKKSFAFELDGLKLHELYFDNLKNDIKIDKKSKFFQKIEKEFKNFQAWVDDFTNTGLTRGIGWVILYYDVKEDKMFNAWIDEHQIGHLVGLDRILVMDVWEHAYLTQFGLNRKKYIDTFFNNINWQEVSKRFEKVLKN
ncbi:MAG: Superoxide dismutase [Fe] [Candidatus Anoxychlamydiales bacterium]|nr:Superoxide dismutase [Fe] [Candidatus Anoxychlamydiales bacterium]